MSGSSVARGGGLARIVPLAGHPLVALVAYVAVFMAGETWLPGLFQSLGVSERYMYVLAAIIASVVGYLVMTMVFEGRRPPHELAPGRIGGVLVGAVLGAALCGLVFLGCLAGGWRHVVGTDPHHPLLRPLLIYAITAGICEEIMFRGVLFRMLEKAFGTWLATAASGLVFGLVHLTNPNSTIWGALAIALEAGVAFALLYRLTDSLFVVMGVHAAWNFVQGPVLGSAISGATDNGDGLVRSLPLGPVWLSGGEFGLEATPMAVVVWLVLALVIGRLLVRRGLAREGWLPALVQSRRNRAALLPG